ncbi:DUF4136 domain-containing protein [Prolixibacteraceae bacterium Z1-6]|uniref:DUF4136 domain-containing protein n=1 Tax=Draconibacterium aestuarii TaxID=2998507 RepID=A0A9X3F7H0_9BACT|nr:DUF4136 domain-containing protein [Prolixibacteraceae bacterium Z1-6]
MRNFLKLMFFLLPVLLMIYSCHPEFSATIDELDLAITKYDEDQNFDELQTFYLPDTIIYITDDENSFAANVNHTHEEHILSEVRQNLLDLGWTEVQEPTNGEIDSDVSIMVSVLETDISFYYYYWWDYWYWYPWDWWFPGYPGYPWYPIWPGYPTYPSGGYTVGTVIIDMVNMDEVAMPANDDTSIKLPIVWSGFVNGILAGSDQNLQSRLTKQISQVFEQSPYLQN